MKKLLFPLVSGVVLCGATYGLLTNSHADFFPCTEFESTHQLLPGMRPRRVSGDCSLMEVQQDPYGSAPRLTDVGVSLAVAVHVLAFGVGAAIGGAVSRRKKGPAAMA